MSEWKTLTICAYALCTVSSQIPTERSTTQEKAPELKKPEDKKKIEIEQKRVEIIEEDIQIEETATAASAPPKQVMKGEVWTLTNALNFEVPFQGKMRMK